MQNKKVATMNATHKKIYPRNVVKKPDFPKFRDFAPLIQNRVSGFANKGRNGRKANENFDNRSQQHYLKRSESYADVVKNFPSERCVQGKSAGLPYYGVSSAISALRQNDKSKRAETFRNYSMYTGENFYKRNEQQKSSRKNFGYQNNRRPENQQNGRNLPENTYINGKFFPLPQQRNPSDIFIRAIAPTKHIKDSSQKALVKKFPSKIFCRGMTAKNATFLGRHDTPTDAVWPDVSESVSDEYKESALERYCPVAKTRRATEV